MTNAAADELYDEIAAIMVAARRDGLDPVAVARRRFPQAPDFAISRARIRAYKHEVDEFEAGVQRAADDTIDVDYVDLTQPKTTAALPMPLAPPLAALSRKQARIRRRRSEIKEWSSGDIHVGERKRGLDEAHVAWLMESMREVGLLSPITIRFGGAEIEGEVENNVANLVAGLHRLEAAKRLGWSVIDVTVFQHGETDARLGEIAENLHRAELTVQERSDQTAEWVRLVEEKAKGVSVQLGPKPQGGRPEGGERKAARELGISRQEVRRSLKIAAIAPEAKESAKAAGLDNNQKALLSIAAASAEKQVERVQEIVVAKTKPTARPAAGEVVRVAVATPDKPAESVIVGAVGAATAPSGDDLSIPDFLIRDPKEAIERAIELAGAEAVARAALERMRPLERGIEFCREYIEWLSADDEGGGA
jgi:hypothetical protein